MKKNNKTIRRIGLVANLDKDLSRRPARLAASLIPRAGGAVFADALTAAQAGLRCDAFATTAELARNVDLLLVFGGDGTMLRVAREINGLPTPLLGVNAGHLGFLTAVPEQDLATALKKVFKGDFEIESRPLMESTGLCHGRDVSIHALNDIVISHGVVSRLIELEISINDEIMTCYRGDGLIVSSPTGSTAYSLSAGGPIVCPDADVLAITPVCPHTLSNRSVIVSSQSRIRVKLLTQNVETIASADGQVQTPLMPGDSILIRKSRRKVRLLHPCGGSFFDTLRHKLHWRGSNV